MCVFCKACATTAIDSLSLHDALPILMGEMDALLAELEAPGGVKAVVLRSGKPDNFVAGADIKDFKTIRSAMEGERSEEHTSELQSPCNLVCRLLLETKKNMSTQ